MKCPHCLESFYATFTESHIYWRGQKPLQDKDGLWKVLATSCPACGRASIFLKLMVAQTGTTLKSIMVWPKGVARSPIPSEVPEEFAGDYREACNVLADSPKGSAALGRRCLQRLLREKGGVKASDLSPEIDQVLASKALPADLADAIDGIRAIGNFAAHPLKSTNTGLILDVEPGEAEWTLDIVESLFDFYFVRPARLAEKVTAINQKLSEAGKPPLKKGGT